MFQSWCPNVSLWSSNCRHFSTTCVYLSLYMVSFLCLLSVRLSVIRAYPPASKTLQQPFRPFSGDTIMQLCEQTNAVYDSWGWWRWGNAISLYPPALSPPSFTQHPQGPHPQHPSLYTFSSPSFLPLCHAGLVHLSPGNSGEAVCVGSSQQLPSITAHCSVAQ